MSDRIIDELQHNFRVYGWIRMLMMRVYLPLTPIYLTQVGHLTIPQLGLLVSIFGVTSLLANVPTGYLADRWTRKATIVIGSILLAVGALTYAAFPSMYGAIFATVLEAIGYAVMTGSGEALMHDTLVAQGKSHEYVKMLGHAQSFGLVGNVLLVGLVPLTYAINPRLPFIIGALLFAVFVYIASTLVEPPRPVHHQATPRNLTRILRTFVNRYTVVFFIALGLLSCAYISYTSFYTLSLEDLGLRADLMGVLFAAASILGAINGRLVHRFERFSLLQYSLFDLAVGSITIIAVGITRNLVVAMTLFVVNMGFWRIRSIVYQDQLLKRFDHHRYKATLLSTLSFFSAVHLWMPLFFAFIMDRFGYYTGFTIIGVLMIITLVPLYVIGVRRLERLRPHEAA